MSASAPGLERRSSTASAISSSEAIVGGSPYNRTAAELDAFFDRLGRVLTFATRDLHAEALTFAEYRQRFVQASPAA